MKCPIPLPVLQTMWKTQPENTGRKKKIITNKNNKTRLCAVQVAMYLRDIFLYAFSLRCAFAGHFTCCLVKDCNVKIQKCTANFKPFNQSHNMHLAKSSFFFFFFLGRNQNCCIQMHIPFLSNIHRFPCSSFYVSQYLLMLSDGFLGDALNGQTHQFDASVG